MTTCRRWPWSAAQPNLVGPPAGGGGPLRRTGWVAPVLALVLTIPASLAGGAGAPAIRGDEPDGPGLVESEDGTTNTYLVEELWLNRMIFRVMGTTAEIQLTTRSNLALELDRLVKPWGLTGAQREKLQTAALMDLKRFFDQVECVRRLCQGRTFEVAAYPDLCAALAPLQAEFSRGFLKEGSLFSKTLRGMDRNGRLDAYFQELRKQRVRLFENQISHVSRVLAGRFELDPDQVRRLDALFRARVAPFQIVDQTCLQGLLYKLSQIEPAELEPIFHDDQWQEVKLFLQQQEANGPALRRRGLFEDEPPDPSEPSLDLAERFKQSMPRPFDASGDLRR